MTAIIVSIVLVLFLVGFVVLLYNGLIGKKNRVENALGSIDVQLKKRHDLIPNLINCVKGYMEHEKEVLNRVTELRESAQAAAAGSKEKFEAEGALGAALGQINLRAEAYPDLKSSENFLQLQRSLNEVEEQLAASRRTYNSSVEAYNNGVEMFPSNVVAGMMNFSKRDFFEAADVERAVPNVEF